MKLIVITRPDFFEGEADAIGNLFRAGLQTLHLRKPGATTADVEHLLQRIDHTYHDRIVLHEHFDLVPRYGLKGIHLNARNPEPPQGYTARHISRSCHTLEEVVRHKAACTYVFLSPIFDSISKQGYASSFDHDTLQRAQREGIIDEHVVALGGIDAARLPQVEALGFGGAAVLGDVWRRADGPDFVPHFARLRRAATGEPPTILTIAGSDCSGGAGIQADIKTISALGGYAASVVTAVTAQNTRGVQGVYPMTAQAVEQQIVSIADDLDVQAIKVGMACDADIAHAIARGLEGWRGRPAVCDPVMLSTSGRRLLSPQAVGVLEAEVFPHCALITPNLPETSCLLGRPVASVDEMDEAARLLARRYGTAVLVKGGHLDGDETCDVLCHSGDRLIHYPAPRLQSPNTHGTGCTLSSAIATLLGRGQELPQAVGEAKLYLSAAIAESAQWRIGDGNGPLSHFNHSRETLTKNLITKT